MNATGTILKKELRAYFLSPIALIFLGVFLLVNLFVFFTWGRFFARNIADIRLMFEWLPILLIFLTAAISMRAWSEEQASGTLEILMTLPIRTRDLVLGKLAAGMLLVGVALALTLPIPITVSLLGDLDIGPVLGGYVGAFFLAAAYLSIGMCVSSRTDNQLVSLMLTVLIGAALYLIGADPVVAFFGNEGGELLRSLGSGSRFANIERGVIDLRDIFYYASIAGFFAVLNIYFIDRKRADAHRSSGKSRLRARQLAVVLMGANMLAGNLWLAPVSRVRADLTEDRVYSVSRATANVLDALNEPLQISGYFSEKTHPLLAPLVPTIRDMLGEYRALGGSRVTVNFADPNKDSALEEELAQQYDIKPLPFRISGRHEESVVNSYFHILVRYGDQFEVLSFHQLIEVQAEDANIDVRLRNLEYDLTRAIKKASGSFQSIESVLAGLATPAKLSLFVTPDTLPEELKEAPETIRKVAEEIAQKTAGRFVFEEVNLDGDKARQQQVQAQYGFRPMALDLFGETSFFLYLLVEANDRSEPMWVQGDTTEAAMRQSIEGALKRSVPGFMKTIGIVTAKPEAPPSDPRMPPHMQPPPPQPEYRLLEQSLVQEFQVERLDLESGVVPGHIDVLIVAKPGEISENALFAIDQYLMGGGAVVALTGDREIQFTQQGVEAVPASRAFLDMLKTWGVSVSAGFAMDNRNARFPVPVQERKGMFVIEKIEMMNYPFFADVRQDSFNKGHITTAGLQNVVMNWSSPLELAAPAKGVDAQTILSTSKDAWISDTTQILPESLESAQTAYQPQGTLAQHTLGVALSGAFTSHFADKPSPLFGADTPAPPPADADADAAPQADRTGRTLKVANQDARLVVVGSSAFASDVVASLGQQMGGNVYRSNMQFARNLIDWSLADTDLLNIRSSGAYARTLKPLEDKERNAYELANYLFVLLALAAVVVISITRRRATRSILKKEVSA
ncbi:MAG: Gldg family protein [Proteobacteria bacterium]|nr:Gldg family protein [Pseudomonadota bacterium]